MAYSLQRSISVWQGMALYVGAVVGSGILILPGMTAGIAGANALLSWTGMVLLSIPLAFTFALLGKQYPSAGGVSTFVEQAFGTYAGAIIGWFYFIAASAGQFIVPLTGGLYVTYVFHLPNIVAFIVAAILLGGGVTSNYLGLKMSGKVQLVTSGLILVVLLSTILFSLPSVHIVSLLSSLSVSNPGQIGKASMLIFWSFFGWEAISSLVPEFNNPRQDVTRATWGAIVIVGVLYLGIALAVIGTHSYSVGQQTLAEAMNNASLAQVMSDTVGVHGAEVTAVVALIICLGTTNAFVASISRLAYSLAHERVAPSWFDHINETRSTPQRAVLLVGALAGAGLISTYVFNITMRQLVYIPNSLGIATYVVGTAAGVKLIRSRTGKIMAAIAFTFCVIAYPFVGSAFWIPIIVGISCVAYLFWRQRNR